MCYLFKSGFGEKLFEVHGVTPASFTAVISQDATFKLRGINFIYTPNSYYEKFKGTAG